MHFPLTSWATLATLLMYFWIIYKVGAARGKYQVHAPSVDGPPEFLRALRVQINTVEQLVFFFPAMWLCAYWFSDMVAAMGGALWLLGRVLYALAYYRDATKRSTGFAISTLAALALALAAAYGLLR
ncbi:MAPEG family protein [soil metagenome]